jgi:hypothetical protein
MMAIIDLGSRSKVLANSGFKDLFSVYPARRGQYYGKIAAYQESVPLIIGQICVQPSFSNPYTHPNNGE